MIEFWHDYHPHCNWYTFSWINIVTEWDLLDNSLNLELGLLGLNVRISYALPWDTKQSKKLRRELNKAAKELNKLNNKAI